MTWEEIQQKAYEVYPLDLDRHLIIEGEPYDNNREKREAYIRGLTDSKPSLPSNLDEAAQKVEDYYDVGEEHGYLYCHRGDIKDAFKAGAKWMAEQGVTVEGEVIAVGDYNGTQKEVEVALPIVRPRFECEDKVIISIRKKDE